MIDSILVIGATGSVGFEVATRLMEQNQKVKIAVRNPERARKIDLNDVEFVHFEYHKPETFENTFRNVSKVLLVSPPSYLKIENQVINAIDSAISFGVELFVNISAISIESKLDKPMKIIEDHLRESEVNSVFLRPNCYMQNFKDLFKNLIVEENQIAVPAGDSKICFVDIRDVAEVAVKALTDKTLWNNTFNLTGGQSINMHVVAHLFSEELDKEIDYISVSDDLFKKRLKSAGWPSSTIEGTMQLCSHVKSGETAVVSGDIEKILGRPPKKMDEFIKDYSQNWT